MNVAGEKILVVDDNAQNLKLSRVLLMTEGYEVQTAVNAEEAILILASQIPDMILMDIQLPGIDGLELTRRLRADPPTEKVLIIALTAYAMKNDEERALRAGCDGYVAKPIDVQTLPALLRGYLDARSTKAGCS